MFTPAALNDSQPIRSKDIVMPSLLVLAQAQRAGVEALLPIEIRKALEPVMVLSPADKERQPDRETRFGRTIRNALVSHRVLEREGLSQAICKHGDLRLRFKITEKGEAELAWHMLPMLKEAFPNLLDAVKEERVPTTAEGVVRASESDANMVNMVLLVTALLQDANGMKPVNTTHVRRATKALPFLRVAPEDVQPSASRKNEIKLDQVLRNMVGSNDKLKKLGLVERTKEGTTLTNKGMQRLLREVMLPQIPIPPGILAQATETLPDRRSRVRTKI